MGTRSIIGLAGASLLITYQRQGLNNPGESELRFIDRVTGAIEPSYLERCDGHIA
ncbi:MAG: hypothetical protein EBE86_003350 [Hormoscilla sp. GUM202]|nr:hypothetical protein [Hormoscilla sp. GUM202]